jgi:GR25 family glycosyltransferase involved in LPS biosynthesis
METGAISFPTTTTTAATTASVPLQRAPSWSIDTIPAMCITLERRLDRWKRFQDQRGLGLLNVQRFLGVDGKTLDLKNDPRVATMTKRNIMIKSRRSHEELDSIGGVGCALSHIAVWMWMIENNQEFCLVFEDDAVVPDGFIEKANRVIRESKVLREPGGWDMWLLGGLWDDTSSIPQEPRASGVVRVGAFMLAHAYVMTLSMAKRMVEDVFPIHAHIDLWMSVYAYMNDLRVVGSLDLVLRQYQQTTTDIQTAKGCKLCNVPTDYDTQFALVPKWEWRLAQTASVALGGVALWWMYIRARST